MRKPYTEDDFSQFIFADRTWRIKEISDLKTAIRRSDKILERVLLRALVTISYAHWEGHVRYSARLYLTHIAIRKLPLSELNVQFLKNTFLPRLTALSTNKANLTARCELLEDILAASPLKFSRVNDDLVNTKSNLNSEVLRDICQVCGLAFADFEDHIGFIDTILLKRRNAIAHGEDAFIDKSDLDQISNTTISLMRLFGDGLDNIVQLKSYKAA